MVGWFHSALCAARACIPTRRETHHSALVFLDFALGFVLEFTWKYIANHHGTRVRAGEEGEIWPLSRKTMRME